MNRVSISVVIPAYNAEAFIKRAVDSALCQTLSPVEILVIDDGSRDKTFQIASSFGGLVKALTKFNGGPASARNLGVRQAGGEWIAFLDADDAWLPQKLEKQVTLIDSNVGIVHSGARGRSNSISSEITFAQLWHRNCILNSSVLLRREAFIQTGCLDEDPELIGVEDYNLWLRIAAAGWKIRTLPEDLCLYTPAAGGLSRQVLRFAKAELANARKTAKLFGLSGAELRKKELSIFDEYGLELLYTRDLGHAREYFFEGLRRQIRPARMLRWAATLLPRRVLDFRRTVEHGLK